MLDVMSKYVKNVTIAPGLPYYLYRTIALAEAVHNIDEINVIRNDWRRRDADYRWEYIMSMMGLYIFILCHFDQHTIFVLADILHSL